MTGRIDVPPLYTGAISKLVLTHLPPSFAYKTVVIMLNKLLLEVWKLKTFAPPSALAKQFSA